MKKINKNLFKICIIGIMAALFMALDLISLKIGDSIKITFGGLPLLFVAFYLDPISAMTTGLIGSFISQLLSFGISVTTPLWVLPTGARGLIAGLLFIVFRKKPTLLPISVSIIVSSLATSVLNTIGVYINSKFVLNNYLFETFMAATIFRFISSIITAIVYIAIIFPLLKLAKAKSPLTRF